MKVIETVRYSQSVYLLLSVIEEKGRESEV